MLRVVYSVNKLGKYVNRPKSGANRKNDYNPSYYGKEFTSFITQQHYNEMTNNEGNFGNFRKRRKLKNNEIEFDDEWKERQMRRWRRTGKYYYIIITIIIIIIIINE